MGIGKDILKYNEELETAHRTLAQMFCHQIEKAIGKFQAAGFPLVSNEDAKALEIWFQEAIAIQWDYANLPKKRALEKLTGF